MTRPVPSWGVGEPPGADSAAFHAAKVLKQCLALLNGPSDEHKFAGLIMVTKHVPLLQGGAGPAPANTLTRVCDAVGTLFLLRLLKTDPSPRNKSTDEPEQTGRLSPYQNIALGVLCAFCLERTLAPRFANFAPGLVRAIRRATIPAEAQPLSDAMTCIHELVSDPNGLAHLLRAGAAQAVASRLPEITRSAQPPQPTRNFPGSGHSRERNKRNGDTGAPPGGGRASASAGGGEGEPMQGPGLQQPRPGPRPGTESESSADLMDRAASMALSFLNQVVAATRGACLGPAELTRLAQAFAADPTARKFEAMDLILRWLSHYSADPATLAAHCRLRAEAVAEQQQGGEDRRSNGRRSRQAAETDASAATALAWARGGRFAAAMRSGLLQALHGASPELRRDGSLTLLALMLRVLGPAWAVEEEETLPPPPPPTMVRS